MKIHLILSLIFILSCHILYAQKEVTDLKRILGKPERFSRPPGHADQKRINDFINAQGKSLADPWIVISDRDNNAVYDKPNGRELDFRLKFKEHFWVAEEKGEWIRIVKVSPRPTDRRLRNRKVYDYGWIEKSKMLLWTDGLISPNSGIHQKAFLLNKANEVSKIINEKKDFAQIYKSPNSTDIIEEKNIYEFYFVFKKEENRYLISKEVSISTATLDDEIVGWVDRWRLEEWNTRIALEPNFDAEAFRERKNNSDFRLIGYDHEDFAYLHSATGKPQNSGVLWDNDPVTLSPSSLDPETQRRFMGTVVRFPMFDLVGDNMYRTGVIGDINVRLFGSQMAKISEIEYSNIVNKIEKTRLSTMNFDIMFLVDGSMDMEFVKSSIANTINSLNRNNSDGIKLRYAIALYRDLYDGYENLLNILPLTQSIERINTYLNQILFGAAKDFDDYTVLHYNLRKSIIEAGFNRDHTNIVMVVGKGADYRASLTRRLEARNNKEKTFIDMDQVLKTISDFNINLSFLQVINRDTEPSRWFLEQAKTLTLETAKEQFAIYRNIENYVPELSFENPRFDRDLEDNKMITLRGGSSQSYIAWPGKDIKMSEAELQLTMTDIIEKMISFNSSLNRILTDVFLEGRSFDSKISAGSFSPKIAQMLKEAMGGNIESDVAKVLLKEKYKLYIETYIPIMIRGAKHPTISYVLFMPKKELDDYIYQLEKLAIAGDMEISAQREELFNTLVLLLNQYSGFEWKKRDLKKASLNDLRTKMHGLQKEGLVFDRLFDIKLEDIKNDRRFPDEEVVKFIQQLSSKIRELKRIQSLDRRYVFSYSTVENVYFWIPLDYTL